MQEAIVKKATVVHERWKDGKLIGQDFEHKIVYICQNLDEAYEWIKEHQDMLNSDEQYDIYYRYEK